MPRSTHILEGIPMLAERSPTGAGCGVRACSAVARATASAGSRAGAAQVTRNSVQAHRLAASGIEGGDATQQRAEAGLADPDASARRWSPTGCPVDLRCPTPPYAAASHSDAIPQPTATHTAIRTADAVAHADPRTQRSPRHATRDSLDTAPPASTPGAGHERATEASPTRRLPRIRPA